MTLPFAALVAVVAAILETSVMAELPLAGATADLVLVCAVAATIVLGIEDGLVIGFVGGLLVDVSVGDRPLGAATLALLLTLGIAILVARAVGPSRRAIAIGLVLVLTAVYHVLFAAIMVPTTEAPFAVNPTVILVAAVLNAVLAIPIAAIFGAIERRFGPAERVDW